MLFYCYWFYSCRHREIKFESIFGALFSCLQNESWVTIEAEGNQSYFWKMHKKGSVDHFVTISDLIDMTLRKTQENLVLLWASLWAWIHVMWTCSLKTEIIFPSHFAGSIEPQCMIFNAMQPNQLLWSWNLVVLSILCYWINREKSNSMPMA